MEIFFEYLPLLIPVIILQLVLAITAIVDIRKNKRFKFGSTPIWLVIVIFLNIIGPILYFIIGKAEEQ